MDLISGLKWFIPTNQDISHTGLNTLNTSWVFEKIFGNSLLLKENASYINENGDSSQEKTENKSEEKNKEPKESKSDDKKTEDKSSEKNKNTKLDDKKMEDKNPHSQKDVKSQESHDNNHEEKLNKLEEQYKEHCKHLENNGKRISALEDKLKKMEESHNKDEKEHNDKKNDNINDESNEDNSRNNKKDNVNEKGKSKKMKKKTRKGKPSNKKDIDNNDSDYDGDDENSDTTIHGKHSKYYESLSTNTNSRSDDYYSKEESDDIDNFSNSLSDDYKRNDSKNKKKRKGNGRHKSRHNIPKMPKRYDPFGFDESYSSDVSEITSTESRYHHDKPKKNGSKHKDDKRRYSESTSNPDDSTFHTLFPGHPKKMPTADGIYFVTTDGEMKKAYGPFHDDEKNPMYYPGIHQLTDKEGRRVIEDQKYRMHPAFMAQLAKGGFYERRVIKPKDEKGAEVVEERFGYFPQRNIVNESVSEESNCRENPRFITQNPFRQLFPLRYNNTLGNCLYMEKYLENRLDEIKSKHKQDIIDLEDKTQHLKDFFIKTTDKLENNINNKTMADIRKNIDNIENDLREKRGKKYTDDKVGQGNASKLLKAISGPAGALS